MKLSSLFPLLLLPPLTWVWIKMEYVWNIVLYMQTIKKVLTFSFQKPSNSERGILSGQGRRWSKVVNCWIKVTSFIHWTKFLANIHGELITYVSNNDWHKRYTDASERCLASWHPQSKGQDLLENIKIPDSNYLSILDTRVLLD